MLGIEDSGVQCLVVKLEDIQCWVVNMRRGMELGSEYGKKFSFSVGY